MTVNAVDLLVTDGRVLVVEALGLFDDDAYHVDTVAPFAIEDGEVIVRDDAGR